MAAFDGVDLVTPFDEPTCDLLLELIRPDVHGRGPTTRRTISLRPPR